MVGLATWSASAQELSSESGASADEVVEEFDATDGEDELGEADAEDLEPDERYRGMEEILVTAQGGTQNLQDVGVSVAAFDADYLEALGAQNIADISQFTPNLEIRTVFAASNPTLFIRGVGLRDFNANSASAVAVYNDDIYMNSPAGQLGQLFDVQQVEVLRGPQGTLYGRNASAGAIRVITRKPSGDTNGYAKATYGRFNEIEAEAAMEAPISDTLSMRISARTRKREGTTKNRCADPTYNTFDDTGDPNSFHNLVHKTCFNPSDTSALGGYFASGVKDQALLTPDGFNTNGVVNFYTNNFRHPIYVEAAEYTPGVPLLQYFLNRDFENDVVKNGALPIFSPGQCTAAAGGGLTGCSFADSQGNRVPDPEAAGYVPLPAAPPPYYSQEWQRNETPRDIKLWTNDVDNWAARGLLRWQPSESVDWVLNLHGGMNRGDSRQFQAVGAHQLATSPRPDFDLFKDGDEYFDADLVKVYPIVGVADTYHDPELGNPYEGDYNRDGTEMLNLYGASLSGDFRFGDDNFLFRTITGYEANERAVDANLDSSPRVFGLEPTLRNESWQVSQEFKLNWDNDDVFAFETGASYLYESLKVNNDWPLTPLDFIYQRYSMDTNYASVYGWLDWHPSDDFAITMGGRWNFETKDMDLRTENWLRNLQTGRFQSLNRTSTSTEHLSTNGPSGDITFTYKPTDDRLFFFKYSRGYKGPHINGLVLNANQQTEEGDELTDPVDPEKVDSLEFGIKTSWFDNQLTVNGAVFYYDYQDIQIFQLRNSAGALPVNQLINAEDADIYGAEIEIRTHPLYNVAPESIDGLELFMSFGWLNSKYTEFVNTISYSDDSGVETFLVEDNSGNRLINSPELAFSGYISWPLSSRFGMLTPRLDWSYKDQVFFSARNNPDIAQDPLWLLNLRVAYSTPGGGVELAGWVRNIADEAYRVDVLNLARFRSSVLYVIGDPRTYGVTLNVRF